MKKFLVKVFTWIGECAACEQAMYEALYDTRIKPLISKILCRDEKISRLEAEVLDAKKESEVKKAETPKPKRKYTKRKKANNEQK